MKKVFNISTKSSETDTNKPSKKRKVFKTLGFSSLALLMGAAGVFAFAPLGNAPMSPNTLNASATTQGQTFDLGLDPQNDPVVYTTESGLKIKKSNGKYSSTTTVTTNKGFSYTQDLRNFYYFTMGSFSGTIYTAVDTTTTYTVTNEPVNWLIIGRGPGLNFVKETPAGQRVESDRDKGEITVSNTLYLPNMFADIPEHSDIPKGCMLVLSEKLLGKMYFNSRDGNNLTVQEDPEENLLYYSDGVVYGNRYRFMGDINTNAAGEQTWTNKPDGSLYTYINSLFSKNTSGTILKNSLGFTQAQADLIVPQQLYTFYSNGSGHPLAETPSTDGGTYYTMFPLAYRAANSSIKQNFCVEDYLKIDNNRIAILIGSSQCIAWATRTGAPLETRRMYTVNYQGEYNSATNSVRSASGVRPAMVMKLS